MLGILVILRKMRFEEFNIKPTGIIIVAVITVIYFYAEMLFYGFRQGNDCTNS